VPLDCGRRRVQQMRVRCILFLQRSCVCVCVCVSVSASATLFGGYGVSGLTCCQCVIPLLLILYWNAMMALHPAACAAKQKDLLFVPVPSVVVVFVFFSREDRIHRALSSSLFALIISASIQCHTFCFHASDPTVHHSPLFTTVRSYSPSPAA